MAQHVMETVLFSLVPGTDPGAFLKLAEAVTAYLNRCPGFVSRRLSCIEDGRWIDQVEWEDMNTAKAAADGFYSDPGNAEFLQAIHTPSINFMHSTLEISVN